MAETTPAEAAEAELRAELQRTKIICGILFVRVQCQKCRSLCWVSTGNKVKRFPSKQRKRMRLNAEDGRRKDWPYRCNTCIGYSPG